MNIDNSQNKSRQGAHEHKDCRSFFYKWLLKRFPNLRPVPSVILLVMYIEEVITKIKYGTKEKWISTYYSRKSSRDLCYTVKHLYMTNIQQ